MLAELSKQARTITHQVLMYTLDLPNSHCERWLYRHLLVAPILSLPWVYCGAFPFNDTKGV